jgi:SpoVK/Ycf46/Vps4 family AAA+-type ATPase
MDTEVKTNGVEVRPHQHQFKINFKDPDKIFDQLKSPSQHNQESKSNHNFTFGSASIDKYPIEKINVIGSTEDGNYSFITAIKGTGGENSKDLENIVPHLDKGPLGKNFNLTTKDDMAYVVEDREKFHNGEEKPLYAIQHSEGMNMIAIYSGGFQGTQKSKLTSPEEFEKWSKKYSSIIEQTITSIYQTKGRSAPDIKLDIKPEEPVHFPKQQKREGPSDPHDAKGELASDIVKNEHPNVSFDEIGGQEKTKEAIREIADGIENGDVYKEWGTNPPKSAMIHGEPGTGKTLLVKALASETKATFFRVSAGDLVSKWHGDSEKKVKHLFELARAEEKSIIFIDEMDSLGTRDENSHEASKRMMNTLLEELDGMGSTDNVTFIGATNRPENLDPALKRPGRIDLWLETPLPDKEGLKQIFNIHMEKSKSKAGRNLFENIDMDKLTTRAEKYELNGADAAEILRRTLATKVKEQIKTGERPGPVTTEDIISSLSSYERINQDEYDEDEEAIETVFADNTGQYL